jgi:hypothetical protein
MRTYDAYSNFDAVLGTRRGPALKCVDAGVAVVAKLAESVRPRPRPRIIESPEVLRTRYIEDEISIGEFETGLDLALTQPQYRDALTTLAPRARTSPYKYSFGERALDWLTTFPGRLCAAIAAIAICAAIVIPLVAVAAHAGAVAERKNAATISHICGKRAVQTYDALMATYSSPGPSTANSEMETVLLSCSRPSAAAH